MSLPTSEISKEQAYGYLMGLARGLRIDQHRWLLQNAVQEEMTPGELLEQIVDAYREREEAPETTSEQPTADSIFSFSNGASAGNGSASDEADDDSDTGQIQRVLSDYNSRIEETTGAA
ncbi:hypothetical protein [Salisaeta longa]|uniref:hypothetical protein n=1 Tax=Salisaeta longa TaxID=503170 RepID=UPI00042A2932|nr:hypothetical protein [Salisaeta longa]